MGFGTFGSSLFGKLVYLAENLRRPESQNVVGSKDFIRSWRQAMGGGVRKADEGPKTTDLKLEPATEESRSQLAISGACWC